MFYTQEEKAKMDMLLDAFQSFIDQQDEYDVIYSRKAGYLRVIIGKNCDEIYFPIAGFADMLRMFVNDFLADEEIRAGHYMKRDYDYVRSQLLPRLEHLEGLLPEACEIMEAAFNANRSQSQQIYNEHLAEIQQLEDLLEYMRTAVL